MFLGCFVRQNIILYQKEVSGGRNWYFSQTRCTGWNCRRTRPQENRLSMRESSFSRDTSAGGSSRVTTHTVHSSNSLRILLQTLMSKCARGRDRMQRLQNIMQSLLACASLTLCFKKLNLMLLGCLYPKKMLFFSCCKNHWLSGLFAESSVRSTGKLFVFIIYKNIFWIKMSKKIWCSLWKQKYWWVHRYVS